MNHSRPSAVAPPVTAEWVRLDPPGAGPHDDPRHPPAGVVPFLRKPVELLTPGQHIGSHLRLDDIPAGLYRVRVSRARAGVRGI